MAEMTLMEAAKLSSNVVDRAITRIITENSPMLEYVTQKGINGGTYVYNMEAALGGIAFRGVNGSYTPSNGVINPFMEKLAIMGGEVKIDNYIVEVEANAIDAKRQHYGMKARAMGLFYSEQFLEGDTLVNPYGFDGMRKRIAGSQSIYIGANGVIGGTNGGGTLTLDYLDYLLDLVAGDNSQKVLFMNKTLRRKITALARAQTGSQMIDTTRGDFNRQHTTYAGATIRVIERDDDASTFLGFDEDDGSSNLDTSSIYCIRFGIDYVHGIMHGGMPTVKDFGESQQGPFHSGRIEGYMGVVVKHPRSAARLSRINNA